MTRPQKQLKLSERMYVRIGKRVDHQAQILLGTHRINPLEDEQPQVQVKWVEWSNEIEWVNKSNILGPVLSDLPPRQRRTPLTAAEQEEERVKREIQQSKGTPSGTPASHKKSTTAVKDSIHSKKRQSLSDESSSSHKSPPRTKRSSPRTPKQQSPLALPEKLTDEQFKKAIYFSDVDDQEEDDMLSIKEDEHDDSYEDEEQEDEAEDDPIASSTTTLSSSSSSSTSKLLSSRRRRRRPSAAAVARSKQKQRAKKHPKDNDSSDDESEENQHQDEQTKDVALPTRATSPLRKSASPKKQQQHRSPQLTSPNSHKHQHHGPMRATFTPRSPDSSQQPSENDVPSPKNTNLRKRQLFQALEDSSDDQITEQGKPSTPPTKRARPASPPSGQSSDDAIVLSSDDENEDYEYQRMKKRILNDDRQVSLSSLSEVSMPKASATTSPNAHKKAASPPQRVVVQRSSPGDTSTATTVRSSGTTRTSTSTNNKERPGMRLEWESVPLHQRKPPPEVRLAEKQRQLEREARAGGSRSAHHPPNKINEKTARTRRATRPPRKADFLHHLVVRYTKQKQLNGGVAHPENHDPATQDSIIDECSQESVLSRKQIKPNKRQIRTVALVKEEEEQMPVLQALRMKRALKKQQIAAKKVMEKAQKRKAEKRTNDASPPKSKIKSPPKRKRLASPSLFMEPAEPPAAKRARPKTPKYSDFDFETEEVVDDDHFVELRRKMLQHKARQRWLAMKKQEEQQVNDAQSQEREVSISPQRNEERSNSFDTQEKAASTSPSESTEVSVRTLIYEGPPLTSLDGGWPKGWVERRYVRNRQQRTSYDSYYSPPGFDEYRLRSRQQVMRYLAVWKETGDAKKAYRARMQRRDSEADKSPKVKETPLHTSNEHTPRTNNADLEAKENETNPPVEIVDLEAETNENISHPPVDDSVSTYDTAPEQMVTDVGLLTQRVSPDGMEQEQFVDSRSSPVEKKDSSEIQEDPALGLPEEKVRNPNVFLPQDPQTRRPPFSKSSQTGATIKDAIELLESDDEDIHVDYRGQLPKVSSILTVPNEEPNGTMGDYNMAQAMAMLDSDNEGGN